MSNFLLFCAYAMVLLPFLLFVIFYGTKSPWKTTAPGRALMILSCTLVIVLINTLLTIAFGAYFGQPMVRIIVIGSSFTSGWYLLITLLRLQYKGRRILDTQAQQDAPATEYDHSSAGRRRRRALRKL